MSEVSGVGPLTLLATRGKEFLVQLDIVVVKVHELERVDNRHLAARLLAEEHANDCCWC